MSDMKEIDARLRELGVERARLMASTGTLPHHMHGRALEWIAEHDELQKRERLAAEAEQKQLALRTLTMAKVAAWAAVVAVMISVLAWLFPRAG
jgi:hypothetical protein